MTTHFIVLLGIYAFIGAVAATYLKTTLFDPLKTFSQLDFDIKEEDIDLTYHVRN